MRLNEVVSHLEKRGFVTRKKWNNKAYVFIGIDNLLCCSYLSGEDNKINRRMKFYNFSLDDFQAKDWEIFNFQWKSPLDDFLPFETTKLDSKNTLENKNELFNYDPITNQEEKDLLIYLSEVDFKAKICEEFSILIKRNVNLRIGEPIVTIKPHVKYYFPRKVSIYEPGPWNALIRIVLLNEKNRNKFISDCEKRLKSLKNDSLNLFG